MNFQKFFDLAKENGIQESQIQYTENKGLSFSLFHHELDSYKVNESRSVVACGIYQGRFGSGRTNQLGKDTFPYLVGQIKEGATLIEAPGATEIFKGSERYRKKNVFNPELSQIPVEKKIALLHEIEDKAYAYDPRVKEVMGVSYSESTSESGFFNSFGLKLRQKSNYCFLALYVEAKQGEETKTFGSFYMGNNFHEIDPDALVKEAVEGALKKFGGESCPSGKYPTVLDRSVFADLLSYFMDAAIADEVQRGSSFLKGLVGQRVASSKVSIEERPLDKTVFFSYFDDEGVASSNRKVIKNGILQTYFYNNETAKKDGVASTGNAVWDGGKIGTGIGLLRVKAGKKSFEEMIAPIQEGVYITEIAGLGTGMNEESGNFSCQAEGYEIKDGKLAKPLNLIVLSGNLLSLMKGIKDLDNAVRLSPDGVICPNVYVKSLSIGGK